MREIRTHGLKRGLPHRKHRGGMPYSTKESVRQRKRHADRKVGCAEGDRRAEAQLDKGMSQTKVKSRMYASKLLTERSPVVKRVMVAETNTDAPKSFCDAPGGTGHRDMARSESSARELGRSAAAKAGAEVGWNRSSVEAGNGRGAKGSCIGSASNRSAGADSLRKKRMTEEEIATIAAKHRMAKFPNLALTRERLSRKAKAEPKFRFYTLYGRVVDEETIRCAWERVWKKDKAPGVDGQTFEAIERGEGGVEGFLASIRRELKAKTYRASPVRRVYIEKANGGLRPLGIPTIKDRVVQMAVKLVMEPIRRTSTTARSASAPIGARRTRRSG